MRQFYFLLTLSFVFIKGYSNNANGYIVTLNNDTVYVQIKLSGGFFFGIGRYDMYKQVEVVDSSGAINVLTPNDIKAYGYTYKSKDYVYRVKPVKDGSDYFLEPMSIGLKTNLYRYIVTRGGGQSTTFQDYYTFEKSDGTYLYLTSYDALETFKTNLKRFYSDNLEVQQLIDKKFSARKKIQKDLQDIVTAVNNS